MSTITTPDSTAPRGPRRRLLGHGTRAGGRPRPLGATRLARALRRAVEVRRRALAAGAEAGMATAEYAIATVAAAGFAGLLLLVLRSDEVRETLAGLVRSALAV